MPIVSAHVCSLARIPGSRPHFESRDRASHKTHSPKRTRYNLRPASSSFFRLLRGPLAMMEVNMEKLKSTVRPIILTILPRYTFVNAITLLMLLAERAVNEK